MKLKTTMTTEEKKSESIGVQPSEDGNKQKERVSSSSRHDVSSMTN